MRYRRPIGLVLVSVSLMNAPLPSQTPVLDSLAVTTAIAQSLLLDLDGAGADHRGPVVFAEGTTPAAVAWAARIAVSLRRDAPTMILDSAGLAVLRFRLDSVSVSDRRILVHGVFAKCSDGHFWTHTVDYTIFRREDAWMPTRSKIAIFSDGSCPLSGASRPRG